MSYNYISPLSIEEHPVEVVDGIKETAEEMGAAVGKAFDDEVRKQVVRFMVKCDVKIDEQEMLKALQYDRDQYEKGYRDGCNSVATVKRREEIVDGDVCGGETLEVYDVSFPGIPGAPAIQLKHNVERDIWGVVLPKKINRDEVLRKMKEDFEARQLRRGRPTNGDTIRAMTDEELADYHVRLFKKGYRCPGNNGAYRADCEDAECEDCWYDWLTKRRKLKEDGE